MTNQAVTVGFLVPTGWTLNVNTTRYNRWQSRRVAVANIRQLAHVTTRNQHATQFTSLVRCDAVFTFPSRHRRDVANWYPTAKAAVDGVVDAGLLVDDDTSHVDGPHMYEAVDAVRARGGIWLDLTFTPMDTPS